MIRSEPCEYGVERSRQCRASGSEEFGGHLEEKRKHGWSVGMTRDVGEEGSDHGG